MGLVDAIGREMEKGMEEEALRRFGALLLAGLSEPPRHLSDQPCRRVAELKRADKSHRRDCLLAFFGPYLLLCDGAKAKLKNRSTLTDKGASSVSAPLVASLVFSSFSHPLQGKAQDALNKAWKVLHCTELDKVKVSGLNDESFSVVFEDFDPITFYPSSSEEVIQWKNELEKK